MPWELLLVVVGLAALTIGFLAGVWTQTRVSEMFWKLAEEKAARKVAGAVKQAQIQRNRERELVNKLKATYGPNLRPDQDEVIEEEVEKILAGDGRLRRHRG